MKRLLEALSTALRGGTREVLESVVDANALRIFAQEIADAEDRLRESKQQLACVLADKQRLQRESEGLRNRLARFETEARSMLETGNEIAARDAAQDITALQRQLEQTEAACATMSGHERQLMKTLRRNSLQLGNFRTELSLARAMQRSLGESGKPACADSAGSDCINDRLRESLQRIKGAQRQVQDRNEALHRIDNLLDAGAHSDENSAVEQVLTRLRMQTVR